MKLLGRGWQYSAYDIGNGRVLKKRNSRLVAYWCMFKSSWYSDPQDMWKFPRYYKSATSNIISSFQKIRTSPVDKKLFANPTLPESGLDYEQDYVESAKEYLSRVSVEEGKKIIDQFVVFAKFLVEQRIADKSFNLGGNFGVNPEGKLILTDIGELYSDPKNIQKEIDKKPWGQPYVLSSIPVGLQSYFVEQMDMHFPPNENVV